MGFVLGLLFGMLAAILLFGLLVYWLCSQPNRMAVAKFINGIAQALAHTRQLPGGATSEEKTDSSEDPFFTRNGK